MQKDVIYIDTEDNITDIIGKVNESEGRVVALVPPKRVGAIQSAVNLKLVHRAAEQANKHLVIVTNNQALSALAGSAGIPIAKNLQSKPEMPEAAAADAEEEDIIDGNDLPVGDHARLANASADGEGDDEAGDKGPAAAGVVGAAAIAASVRQKADTSRGALAATAAKARTKIPNFDSFRKKLFLGIAALVLLIGFLVWAVVYAPQSSIVIKAKTSETALNTKVSVGPTLATDLQAGTIKAELKTTAKDASVAFTATGKKDVGEKSTGTVALAPTAATKIAVFDGDTVTIPAGSIVKYNGLSYLTNSSVVFSDSNRSTTPVGVTAAESGSKYNGATGAASSSPDGTTATFTTATTGGTDKTITVVQQSDIDAVSGDITKASDSEEAKKALKAEFGANYIVIDDTFKADAGAVKPNPAVGQEATDGKGALSGKITYTLLAVPRGEAAKYLDAYFAQQVDGKQDQKVYDNGIGAAAFTTPVADADKYVVTATTNGKIGPKIDENKVKDYAKGKKSGEIKVYVESISGVESADVTFSPFWVTTAPSDINKIKVQFNLNG